MTEHEIKAECERLARLAAMVCASASPESLLAALRVLAGEPDPRDVEIERLRSQLAEAESNYLRCAETVGVIYEADGMATHPGPVERVVRHIREHMDECTRLRADVETLTKRNRVLRKNVAGLDKANRVRREVTDSVLDRAFAEQRKWLALEHRAFVWKRLAKRLRGQHANAVRAIERRAEELREANRQRDEAYSRIEQLDQRHEEDLAWVQRAQQTEDELRKLRDGVRALAEEFGRVSTGTEVSRLMRKEYASQKLRALLGEK